MYVYYVIVFYYPSYTPTSYLPTLYTPYTLYSRTGTVLFAGPVHYAKGMFAGLVMDDPGHGKNSG